MYPEGDSLRDFLKWKCEIVSALRIILENQCILMRSKLEILNGILVTIPEMYGKLELQVKRYEKALNTLPTTKQCEDFSKAFAGWTRKRKAFFLRIEEVKTALNALDKDREYCDGDTPTFDDLAPLKLADIKTKVDNCQKETLKILELKSTWNVLIDEWEELKKKIDEEMDKLF